MANFMFNISKGRAVEFFIRVAANEPANSQILLVPCSASDSEANAQDADTLTAALATAINEQTTSWTRKMGRDSGGDFVVSTPTVDDTNNRYPAAIPEITWTTPSVGNNTTGLLVCYDSDSTSGSDDNVIPICHLDMAVTADGNNVIVNAGDVTRAQ